MTRDSFIARWSRLKGDAAARPGTAQPEAAQPGPEPGPSPAEAGPAQMSAEEIAALPPVDALTALSDITPYLRRGVPALLRNAAMRRMWSLNPAIRDYVDDATEYAMDWNTPGAILGNGPLGAGDDAAAMARRLVGEVENAAGALAGAPAQDKPQAKTDERPAPTAPEAAEPVVQPTAQPVAQPARVAHAEVPDDPPKEPAPAPRRHGGATPT